MPEDQKLPTAIRLKQQSQLLRLEYKNDLYFELSFEYLRVCSPSAEVRGHGAGDAVLQLNKEEVMLNNIEPVGNYAVKLYFDDGHDSGLYTWEYLYELGENKADYWQKYLQALSDAGHERKEDDK